MPQLVEITINKVEIAVRRDDDADVFVGFCPRFRVYSQGETPEEAVDAVSSAIALRLSTAFEHGRMNTILRNAGFERYDQGAQLSPDAEFVWPHDLFFASKTIEQLLTEQGIQPISDLGVFAGAIPDEDLDEFISGT